MATVAIAVIATWIATRRAQVLELRPVKDGASKQSVRDRSAPWLTAVVEILRARGGHDGLFASLF